MKTLSLSRNKSFEWSFGIHLAIILLGLVPFAHQVMEKNTVEYELEIGYVTIPEEIKSSGSEGLAAKSPVYNDEPEPTMEQPEQMPIPVEETTEVVEQPTIADNNADVVSDVTSETDSEVAASESSTDGSDETTNANGGGHGSPIEGDQDGAALEGDGGGGDGLEGDGVITRRIVYREDITQVAKVSGRVTLNVCIDRQGKVVYAAYDPEKTTIEDKDILKRATYLATRYRYETNYKAPMRECGQLTFIFSIEEDIAQR